MKIIISGGLIWLTILTLYTITVNIEPEPKITPNVTTILKLEPSYIEEEIITDDFFYTTAPINISNDDLNCLTKNVFFEAGIEDYEGKLAVAQVTLNRVETARWGHSVCSVVFAKAQFSWTLWKKNRTMKPSGSLWEDSKRVVYDFINGTRISDLDESLHYHADYIDTPFWADEERQIIQIGKHIFYEG